MFTHTELFCLFPATTDAAAGADFVPLANVVGSEVSFADGETTANCVVTIIDDDLDECDEIIILTLDTAIGGGTVGTQGTHELTILDDDSEYSGIAYGCLPI